MEIMLIVIFFAVAAILATIHDVRIDGYRRAPVRLELERDPQRVR